VSWSAFFSTFSKDFSTLGRASSTGFPSIKSFSADLISAISFSISGLFASSSVLFFASSFSCFALVFSSAFSCFHNSSYSF
jgi:hypothetical protein